MSALEQTQTGKTSGGKIAAFIGCGCGGILLLIIAGVGAIFFFAIGAMKKSEPFIDSIAAIETNPAAASAIGTPVEPGFMVSGSVNTTNGDSNVDLTIPVSGPNGKGSIRVVGSKSAGATDWTYDTWQLDVEGGESIPLGQ